MQCRSCVGGLGHCVGTDTCCGQSIGCVMTSALFDVASDCSAESDNKEPCQVPGVACSVQVSRSHRATGVCVAPGICCDGGERSIHVFFNEVYCLSTFSRLK